MKGRAVSLLEAPPDEESGCKLEPLIEVAGLMRYFLKRDFGSRVAGVLFAASLAAFSAASALAQQPLPPVVARALQNELAASADSSHPMRYQLRKSSPRLTTTKNLIETKDGLVALLIAVNDAPPSADDAQKEQSRLNALAADPGKQQHRKQSEDADTARAMKILRALPKAFVYQDAGTVSTHEGTVENSPSRQIPDSTRPI